MNDLILDNLIKEKRDITNISYILEDSSLFFETGYKVLQNQEKNGFIKAVKVIHNGKIKLIYDISKYKSLASIMPGLNAASFLIIMSKLFDIICETIENGFMQIENININFENIFIDTNNLNVNLIYIPVNTESNGNSKSLFEERLKGNIARAISANRNIDNELVNKLYSNLSLANNTIEMLRDYINTLSYTNTNYNQIDNRVDSKVNIERKSTPSIPVKSEEVKSNKESKFISAIKGVFKFNNKKDRTKVSYEKNRKVQAPINNNDSLETEVLSGDMFIPTIAIVREDALESVNIPITKENFLIGKSVQMADGVISFNKAISRIHCRIIYIDGRYFIKDEKSVNGTFVNNRRVPVDGQVPIKTGDIIRLANSDFQVKSI
nr:FHA domain-containing protein [uncultured Clostridium sp.]